MTDEGVTIDPAEDLDADTLLSLGWDDPDAPQMLPRSVLERTTKADIESYVKVFRLDPDARERSETERRQ